MASGRRSMPKKTQMGTKTLPVLALLAGLLSPGTTGFAQGTASLYESVQAILAENCLSCHGAAQMSGLDLRQPDTLLKGGSRGPGLVPGKAEESLLFQAAAHRGELRMPPESARLSREKLDLIRQWIDAGALWEESAGDPAGEEPDWWSFRKPRRPPLPLVDGQEWQGNPIDAFVLAKLREKGLTPAPPAGKQTLIRRAYFDLIGLPPTPEQVDRFLKDSSPRAFQSVVNELLASPRYGERWGRHWLDVVRYADSAGFETDAFFPHAWRYRDYVIKSFNEDKPFDRFLQEQIAADELWPNNLDLEGSYAIPVEKLRQLEARVGTGLYGLVPQTGESKMDASRELNEILTDWVDTTASAFMGITLGCARCHDHKFDPLSQRDYYRFRAIFAASDTVEIPVVTKLSMFHRSESYSGFLTLAELRWTHRRLEKKVSRRVFEAKKAEFPAEVVEAYKIPDDDRTPEQEKLAAPLAEALKLLGDPVGMTLLDLEKHLTPQEKIQREELVQKLGQAVLKVPTTEASHQTHYDALFDIPKAVVMGHRQAELVPAIHVLDRGDLGKNLEKVEPGLPRILANGMDLEQPSSELAVPRSRAKLALWLSRPDHPLTARVLANRLWQWHFGSGIVSTPNDFGRMGAEPTHPELLDWLATELVRRGWSLKSMHRLIMASEAYQRTSRYPDPAAAQADPNNLYLWRTNRRRLEAEALWDALHAAAGTINLKLGGRAFCPPLEEGALSGKNWVRVYADPEEQNRRAVYILVQRNFGFPMFETFDTPDPAVSCSVREVTTVPPQALFFLNDKMVFTQAQAFAARLVREVGDDPSGWIRQAWRIALGREPTAGEQEEAGNLLESLTESEVEAGKPGSLAEKGQARTRALTQLCLAVFNLSEFSYVD